MGTFAGYAGELEIPAHKREEFSNYMIKLLNYGGMMKIETVSIYGHELGLLKPLSILPGGKVSFYYNYFEDDSWETAGYDAGEGYFWSNKIGGCEFNTIILAAYTLCELYDKNLGFAILDGEIYDPYPTIAWFNNLLGTDFSMEKRSEFWRYAEAYSVSNKGRTLSFEDLMDITSRELLEYSGGTELTDLCYIINGTDTLTDDQVIPGSYPSDVLVCKKHIAEYLGEEVSQDRKGKIYELLTMDISRREDIDLPGLEEIAQCSLILSARTILYLTSEVCHENFWEQWRDIRTKVYHDERTKSYASEILESKRKARWRAPIQGMKTSEFLKEDDWFTFWDTPEELMDKPKYIISDDDRLYWWDGSDEVIISKKMDEWMTNLASRHKMIMSDIDSDDTSKEPSAFLKDFLNLIAEVDKKYERILPFHDMFYEFADNGYKSQYRAAVTLLRELSDENWEEGKAIQFRKGSWDLNSRKVTFNPGRLNIKRYMSILANKKIRIKYFGF